MVGERDEVRIEGFRWTEHNQAHLLREHGLSVADVLAVREGAPLIFRAAPREGRVATHAMVGRDSRGRSLIIFISETEDLGMWFAHTGYRAQLAHRLLEREGKSNAADRCLRNRD